MPDIGDFSFQEYGNQPKSPHQQSAIDQGRVTRTLYLQDQVNGITEDIRFQAVAEILGFPEVVDAGAITYLSRSIPDQYPSNLTFCPQNLRTGGKIPFLFATSVKTEPKGKPMGEGPNGEPIYAQIDFEIEYNTAPYLIQDDLTLRVITGPLIGFPDEGESLATGWLYTRYITRNFKSSSVLVNLPQGFLLNEQGKTVYRGFPFREVSGDLTYTWHQVPIQAIPSKAIQQSLASVNNDTFDGFPKGTLCLLSMTWQSFPNSLGIRMLDITYHMKFRPNYDVVSNSFKGWNSNLQVDSTNTTRFRYLYITRDGAAPGANNTVYRYVDFASLFRPDQ